MINKFAFYKTILLLSGMNLSTAYSMEEPPKPHTEETDHLTVLYRAAVADTQNRCLQLMDEGARSTDQPSKIDFFQQALSVLMSQFVSYSLNCNDISFTQDDKAYFIQMLYNISEELYTNWTTHITHTNPQALNDLRNVCLSLVRIDDLIFQHFQILHPNLLPTINISLATSNFLTHVASIFANFHQELGVENRGRNLFALAKKYHSSLRDNIQYRTLIDTNMTLIHSRMQEIENPSRPMQRLGRRARLLQQQAAISRQEQVVELVAKQHESIGSFDINSTFTSIIDLKNLASLEWEKNKDLEAYINKQDNTRQKIGLLEDEIAKQLKLEKSAAGWTTGDFKTIYSYLSEKITFQLMKRRIDEFLTIFLCTGDYTGANLRLHAFVELMGGSPSQFESVPNDLKFRYAAVKYFLGEPEVWEQFVNKEIADQDKKREARRRQRDRQRATAIKEDMDRKAAETQAAEERTQAMRAADLTRKSHSLTHETAPAAATSHSSTISQGYNQYNPTTSESKKEAQRQIEAEERRQAIKAERSKGNDQPESSKNEQNLKQNQINQAPAAPEVPSTYMVSKPTLALYENLYGFAPKLTTDEAIQLLAGFGLTIHKDEGKGSHTKCFLNSGEKIVNVEGKVLWTCPDFEKGLMAIVPRWDGKDIPYYMIKNLRHILEKMGIKFGTTNVISTQEIQTAPSRR